METVKITGKGDLPGGKYESVSISGMGKCTGSLYSESVTVNGTFKCEGSLDCRNLTVNGTCKCLGPLSAEKMTCNGAATIKGDIVANDLTVGGMLHVEEGRLEGTEIACTGSIHADCQVSADRITVTGLIKARELVGDHITIRSDHPGILRQFLPLTSTADLIEATMVELSGVNAKTVNGHDVTIGPGCTVEHLDCSGTLTVHPSSIVSNITGSYTKRG